MAIYFDVEASITGKHSEVVARVRKLVPNITPTYCMIHREALGARHLGQSTSEVLSLCVKVVNSIKTGPLQSRWFSQLCNELELEHSNPLLHKKNLMAFPRKSCCTPIRTARAGNYFSCKHTIRIWFY